jgi:hypothetical protein
MDLGSLFGSDPAQGEPLQVGWTRSGSGPVDHRAWSRYLWHGKWQGRNVQNTEYGCSVFDQRSQDYDAHRICAFALESGGSYVMRNPSPGPGGCLLLEAGNWKLEAAGEDVLSHIGILIPPRHAIIPGYALFLASRSGIALRL